LDSLGKAPQVFINSTTSGRRYSTLQEIRTLSCSGESLGSRRAGLAKLAQKLIKALITAP